MKHTQNTNQEQKKHFLTSHKSIRFTAALCAAAVLVGGVAYAATPDAIAAEPTTAVSESTFTDVIVTTFDETEFPSSDLIRLNASIDEAIILTVIHQKVDAAAADRRTRGLHRGTRSQTEGDYGKCPADTSGRN